MKLSLSFVGIMLFLSVIEAADNSRLQDIVEVLPALMRGGAGGAAATDNSASLRATEILAFNFSNFAVLALAKGIMTIMMLISSPTGLGLMFGRNGKMLKRNGEVRNSIESSFGVDDWEFQWMLQYLKSTNTRDWRCLQKMSCEDPERTGDYVRVGRLMLKMVKFASSFDYLKYNSRYEKVINALEEAANYGSEHGDKCSAKYTCENTGGSNKLANLFN